MEALVPPSPICFPAPRMVLDKTALDSSNFVHSLIFSVTQHAVHIVASVTFHLIVINDALFPAEVDA